MLILLLLTSCTKDSSKISSIKETNQELEMINAYKLGFENINKAEIKLLNDFTVNKFIKGIVDHVEILEINKKIPSIKEVFIKATTDE